MEPDRYVISTLRDDVRWQGRGSTIVYVRVAFRFVLLITPIMSTRALLLSAMLASAVPLLAQTDRLSLGLNASYGSAGNIGLGGAIEFQHSLAPHWELLGQFSVLHMFDKGVSQHGGENREGTYGFFGLGAGYRSGEEGRGFHSGLLVGGLLYPAYLDPDQVYINDELQTPTGQILLPALDLSIGHSIGARSDLSLDLVLGRTPMHYGVGFGTLRFGYLLFKRD